MKLTDYSDPNSFGSRMRRRRSAPLMKIISDLHQAHRTVRLLDVGGRKVYWNILPSEFLKANDVKVTVLNLPGELTGEDDETFTHVAGDACNMPQYGDRHFHLVHANSVIEHVGGWSNVQRFASEVRRVSQALWIQTPNFWFPVEPHYVCLFLHWMPRPLQEWVLLNFALGHKRAKASSIEAAIAEVDRIPRLLNKRAYRILFPDCQILNERFFGFTKSIVAVRKAA